MRNNKLTARLTFAAMVMLLTVAGQVCAQTGRQNRSETSVLAPDLTRNPPPALPNVNPKLPSIFIAGDSTAARGAGKRQQGWAVPFADYFDKTKVNVINLARGGRSSRTFITEGLWNHLLTHVKPGDIVLIQFGQNDGGPINDNRRARGSLPGLGNESQAIDNQLTHKHEVVHTFGWYMRKMIEDTKAKGATPIVLTLTVRDLWHDGHIERGSGSYSPWSAEVARSEHVRFVDVTDIIADKYDAMGQDKVKALYQRDFVHFNAVGADMHAAAVVSGLKGLRPDPIAKFLSAKGKAVPADPFSALQLPLPANHKLPTLFLIGDSTVRNGIGNGAGNLWGWGDFLGDHFDTNKINVVNRAIGGTSSRTYLTGGEWARVLDMVRKSDFVMMQFGHNDTGPLNDNFRARGTIRGVGDESEAITNLLTGKPEVVHSYGWYLRKYISDTRAKGATPIVCSQIPRKIWKDGSIEQSTNSYTGWAEEVATAEHAPFVDLNKLIAERYDTMGPAKVNPLFGDAHTHTTAAGAELNAECVVVGLKALPDDPLAPYLKN